MARAHHRRDRQDHPHAFDVVSLGAHVEEREVQVAERAAKLELRAAVAVEEPAGTHAHRDVVDRRAPREAPERAPPPHRGVSRALLGKGGEPGEIGLGVDQQPPLRERPRGSHRYAVAVVREQAGGRGGEGHSRHPGELFEGHEPGPELLHVGVEVVEDEIVVDRDHKRRRGPGAGPRAVAQARLDLEAELDRLGDPAELVGHQGADHEIERARRRRQPAAPRGGLEVAIARVADREAGRLGRPGHRDRRRHQIEAPLVGHQRIVEQPGQQAQTLRAVPVAPVLEREARAGRVGFDRDVLEPRVDELPRPGGGRRVRRVR